MSPVGAALADFLRRHVLPTTPLDLCVALSGGVDSSALLLAAVEVRDAGLASFADSPRRDAAAPSLRLRAVHVDHGLMPDSTSWRGHCAALCAARAVPFTVRSVDVDPRDRRGIEAAARAARYAALGADLRPGEWLLTAHHADDQLETVLIQLLRGAGVAGLAAMPEVQPLGAGRHGRPLLALRRAALAAHATAAGIDAIADPMNADRRFDRGFLRESVLPQLLGRWPGAAATVARSARHCADAQALLDELAALDAAAAVDGPRLHLAPLAGLDPRRRVNLLRWWLKRAGLVMPSAARLQQIARQMWTAGDERLPEVRWRGGEVRRYRGVLHALAGPPAALTSMDGVTLRPGETLALGPGLGSLRLRVVEGRGLAPDLCATGLRVAARRGGEELRLHAGGPRRPLRLLLQEAGIPPWRRGALPLLWSGRELVAVADRWLSADHVVAAGCRGYLPEWREAPPLD